MFSLNDLSKTKILIIIGVVLLLGFLVYYMMYMRKSKSSEQFIEKSNTMTSMPTITLFFSPKCGHCKSLMEGPDSVWNQFAGKYSDKYDISEINCDEYPDLATENEIHHFPTIKLVNAQGVQKEYNGEHSLSSLSEFADSQ